MELVKELPEIFEEFAEQRQRSFLVMKEVKDNAWRKPDRSGNSRTLTLVCCKKRI